MGRLERRAVKGNRVLEPKPRVEEALEGVRVGDPLAGLERLEVELGWHEQDNAREEGHDKAPAALAHECSEGSPPE